MFSVIELIFVNEDKNLYIKVEKYMELWNCKEKQRKSIVITDFIAFLFLFHFRFVKWNRFKIWNRFKQKI